MDQVKAYVTLIIELISITVRSNVAPGGKYPLQDLNSAARVTRLIRKFLLKFLEGQCLFSQDTIQDEPSTELAETFSNNFRPVRTLYRMNSKDLLFEGFFELTKEQGLLRFFFDDME